jgi:hypothetical protein
MVINITTNDAIATHCCRCIYMFVADNNNDDDDCPAKVVGTRGWAVAICRTMADAATHPNVAVTKQAVPNVESHRRKDDDDGAERLVVMMSLSSSSTCLTTSMDETAKTFQSATRRRRFEMGIPIG